MSVGKAVNFGVWTVVLGFVGWFFYDQYEERQLERKLREGIANLVASDQHAMIHVDSVRKDPTSGETTTSFRWVDTEANGRVLPGAKVRSFTVRGGEVYIDTLQIIFDPTDVKDGDPLRGKAITLWKSAYGESQAPKDGAPIEVPPALVSGTGTIGTAETPELVPPRFRFDSDRAAEAGARLFEQWYRLARDSDLAKREGVRCVQGTAVHKPMVEGKVYKLTMMRTGQILFDGPFEPDPFTKLP